VLGSCIPCCNGDRLDINPPLNSRGYVFHVVGIYSESSDEPAFVKDVPTLPLPPATGVI
jgi:hypothetical protein